METEETSFFDSDRRETALPGDAAKIDGNSATADLFCIKLYGRRLFLKRLKANLADNPAYVAAFEKEFEIGFNLDHPNIVRYISTGWDGGRPYITTQFVSGLTLAKFVERDPGFFRNKERLRRFALQLLSAIGYMHSRQVLHLDLKPDNIMVTDVGREAKIIDLGFSYSDLHQYDTAGHTGAYAAPEQLSGGKKGPGTDLYSFAKVCVFAYTGRQDVDKMPRRWRRIVRQCTDSDLGKRPKSAEEVAKMLAPGHAKAYAAAAAAIIGIVVAAVALRPESNTRNVAAPPRTDTVYVSPASKHPANEALKPIEAKAAAPKPTAEQMEQEHEYYDEHSKAIIRKFANEVYSTSLAFDKAAIDKHGREMSDGLQRLKADTERRWPGSRKRLAQLAAERDAMAQTYISRCYEMYKNRAQGAKAKGDSAKEGI